MIYLKFGLFLLLSAINDGNDIAVGTNLGAEGVSFRTTPSLLSLYHTPPSLRDTPSILEGEPSPCHQKQNGLR